MNTIAKTKRTTKMQIDLGDRKSGGTNISKKNYLFQTKEILNNAREFYTDFLLTHSLKFDETIVYFSEKEQKEKERKINNKELLSWAESLTLQTKENQTVLVGYDFKALFPDMPRDLRRSAINDSTGRVRSHLSNFRNWELSGKTKGKPGLPKASNHPTLYKQVYDLDDDFAHKVARRIADICKGYPGSVLLFEALRKIKKMVEVQNPGV